jgi:hypothetical protein
MAVRIPQEVERVNPLSPRVIERATLRLVLDPRPVRAGLDAPDRLGGLLPPDLLHTQPIDQAVLADVLKDQLIPDLLLLLIEQEPHVVDVAVRLLILR